jgi:ribosomal protein S18 acetylase RimI-like enzyme
LPILHLRPACSGDFSFLRTLHRTALKEYVAQIWGWDEEQQEKLLRERFDPVKMQIIQLEGRDIGVLQVDDNGTEIVLTSILIVTECQNRGIGSQIITDIIAKADERRVPLKLSVLKPNPARTLYERLGFSITSEEEVRYWMTYHRKQI